MIQCIYSHYSTTSEFCAQLESYPRFDQWSFSQPLLIGSSLLLCQSTDTSIWLPHSKPGLSMAKQAKHVFVSYSLTTTVTAIAARQYYRKSNCMSTSKLLSNQTLFDLLSEVNIGGTANIFMIIQRARRPAMFLTLCSHYTVPPWWKQSFHPCFECALHSKTDRFNCTHSYSARQCSDPCISEQSSALMNEASYCMYNIQHFISFRSSIATSKNLLSPARDRSRNSRIDPIRSRVSKPLDQPARL